MRKSAILAILLLTIAASATLFAPPGMKIPLVYAAATPTMEVWSPVYGNNLTSLSNLLPGSEFDVKVNVTNVGQISGYDVSLSYNITSLLPNVLQVMKTGSETSGSLFDPNSSPTGCQTQVPIQDIDLPPGRIRLAGYFNGGCSVDGTNGVLFTLHFKVVGIGATSIDIIAASHGSKNLISFVVTPPPCLPSCPNVAGIHFSGAYFRNKSGLPPSAKFTYIPVTPAVGNNVAFNATDSYDPDNPSGPSKGILKFSWDFDDASGGGATDQSILSHQFRFTPTVFGIGYFNVKLVVIDSDNNLPNRQVSVVYVDPGKIHDLAVSLTIDKPQPRVGDKVGVKVTVTNRGNQDDRGGLNVTYDNQGPQLLSQTLRNDEKNFSIPLTNPTQVFSYTLDTTGLSARVYAITASVKLLGNATDANPLDNTNTVSFTLQPGTTGFSFSLPLLAGLGVVVLAAVFGVVQLMKRRRKDTDVLPE